MKILVDEMPAKVEDCPWSYPTENPWKDRIYWFCNWNLSDSETCPMANNDECPYFTAIAQKSDLDCIIDAGHEIDQLLPINVKKGTKL